jgi:hypothetical protein
MIKFASNSHWYSCRGGTPEAQHDADLRVARKQLLYASPTTIDKDVFKNDFLDRWKMNELVNAAAASFKQPHESDEGYANRIYDLSLTKTRDAANFGKEIHAALEKYPALPIDPRLHPWLHKFGEWYGAHVGDTKAREIILFDHDIGVAGCCDCIASGKGPFENQVIIPDWKSQNVKRDKKGVKKAAFYESWPRQLAFYAVTYAKDAGLFPDQLPTCISLVIDSNEPEAPFMKVWTKEEILRAYRQFVVGAWLWFEKRDYWPQPKGRFDPTFSIPFPV